MTGGLSSFCSSVLGAAQLENSEDEVDFESPLEEEGNDEKVDVVSVEGRFFLRRSSSSSLFLSLSFSFSLSLSLSLSLSSFSLLSFSLSLSLSFSLSFSFCFSFSLLRSSSSSSSLSFPFFFFEEAVVGCAGVTSASGGMLSNRIFTLEGNTGSFSYAALAAS